VLNVKSFEEQSVFLIEIVDHDLLKLTSVIVLMQGVNYLFFLCSPILTRIRQWCL